MVLVGTYILLLLFGNIKRFNFIFFCLWQITEVIFICISTRYFLYMFILRIVGRRGKGGGGGAMNCCMYCRNKLFHTSAY
jgi:hypothetical protein